MIRTLLLLLLALSLPARAEVTDMSQAIAIDVLPGWRRADGTQVAGLRIRLAPGWKTYWRSAGAAGISPQMDWRGSGNLRSVTPMWPTPRVFGRAGTQSIGYASDFVLPLLIPAAGPGPVRLRGVLDIGVCADICLPARLEVAADLPAATATDPVIAAALADRPRRVAVRATCRLSPRPDGMTLAATIDLPRTGRSEAVVFEVPDPSIWITDATVARSGDRLQAVSQLVAQGGAVAVDRGRIRITVLSEDRAVEIDGCAG